MTSINLQSAIKFLLAEGHTTPEEICEVVSDISLVEGCVVCDNDPWQTDDGSGVIMEFDNDYTAREAALENAEAGDWGEELDGSVEIKVWRNGIDYDGLDCRVQESTFVFDVVDIVDHRLAILDATRGDGCGGNPDDHDWTSEGEGGLKENPGVWSLGGTILLFKSHCRKCGLHRTTTDPGSQRGPDEGKTVEYRMLNEEEIAWHRKNGSMNDVTEEVSDGQTQERDFNLS